MSWLLALRGGRVHVESQTIHVEWLYTRFILKHLGMCSLFDVFLCKIHTSSSFYSPSPGIYKSKAVQCLRSVCFSFRRPPVPPAQRPKARFGGEPRSFEAPVDRRFCLQMKGESNKRETCTVTCCSSL